MDRRIDSGARICFSTMCIVNLETCQRSILPLPLRFFEQSHFHFVVGWTHVQVVVVRVFEACYSGQTSVSSWRFSKERMSLSRGLVRGQIEFLKKYKTE